jgi:Flp pilus assembly protein TadD
VRAWARAGLALFVVLGLAGCISIPIEQREWVTIRTGHYEIWSSIGEDETRRIAADLERFRGAVAYVWGSALPAEPARTRVYAFDDRNFPRKFAHQNQRNFLLPTLRGDVIVLRTGGGWDDDAWTELKLQYARRLLWNASPDPLPPWVEAGLPQLASTIVTNPTGAVMGTVRDDHVKTLRASEWIPFDRLLGAADLDGWPKRDRDVLEAESWAICHYLLLGEEHRDSAQTGLARMRTLLREGTEPAEAARSALGDPDQNAVYRHVVRNQFDTARLKLPLRGPAPKPRTASRAEVLTGLGELSLAIGEPAQARGYLEDALEREPGSARALAGLGAALAAERDFTGADERYRVARAAAPDEALIELGYAHLLADRARDTGDAQQRSQLVSEAREHYRKSRALARSLPEADAGIAATYLIAGEDPAQGRTALRPALAALPADAALAQLDARLAIAAGDTPAARRTATRLVTRARTTPELEAARSLLDQIDVQAAIR